MIFFEKWRSLLLKPILDADKTPWEQDFKKEVLGWSWLAQLVLGLSLKFRLEIREEFANRHLRGLGLEIGAQNVPTRLSPDLAKVEYVDRLGAHETAERFGIPRHLLVDVSYLSDGACLSDCADESRDFIIANHVLEHFDNPIAALVEWLRVIRTGGCLFITIPNYRANCYDFRRKPASTEHLAHDYRDEGFRHAGNREHYLDFAEALYGLDRRHPQIQDAVSAWLAADDRHHYHVWDEDVLKGAIQLASEVSGYSLKLLSKFHLSSAFEILAVVEKTGEMRAETCWPNNAGDKLDAYVLLYRLAKTDLPSQYKKRWRNE